MHIRGVASIVAGVGLGALVPVFLVPMWSIFVAMSDGMLSVGYILTAIHTGLIVLISCVSRRLKVSLYTWGACVVVTAAIILTETLQLFLVTLLTAPLAVAIPAMSLVHKGLDRQTPRAPQA